MLLETLPFSGVASRQVISALGDELLSILRLGGGVNVIDADAFAAKSLEADFRRRWWSGDRDPFRDAVHAFKFQIIQEQAGTGAITAAWEEMTTHVHCSSWRSHLRDLTKNQTPQRIQYLRLAFSAAQQVWTRAARWNAAFPGQANPFLLIPRLFENSCWPLGWRDGALQICRYQPATEGEGAPALPQFPLPVPNLRLTNVVFISAPFRQTSTASLLATFTQSGWTTVHGPVGEDSPPERQLAKRINSAHATIGFLPEMDEDFGLPWWMFQELDFARACNRPVALLTGSRVEHSVYDWPVFAFKDGMVEDGFWQWLKYGFSTKPAE